MIKGIATMRKIYSASFFTSLYYGVLVILAAAWLELGGQNSVLIEVSGWIFLASFGIFAIPLLYARVTVDEKGIRQSFFKNQFMPWDEIVAWKRNDNSGSDGPVTLTIRTRRDSIMLNHNCIFGKRLAEVEAQLARRTRNVALCDAPSNTFQSGGNQSS